MKYKELDKAIKLDIVLLILSCITLCIFIGCIIVISLTGQPALTILAQCIPWALLIGMDILFIGAFIVSIRRDADIALTLADNEKQRMQEDYEEKLKELKTARYAEAVENTDKRKANGTTRKR